MLNLCSVVCAVHTTQIIHFMLPYNSRLAQVADPSFPFQETFVGNFGESFPFPLQRITSTTNNLRLEPKVCVHS